MSELSTMTAALRAQTKLLVVLLGPVDGPRAVFIGLKIAGVELPEQAQLAIRDIMDVTALEAAWESAVATERHHDPDFEPGKHWYPPLWRGEISADKCAAHTKRMKETVNEILLDFNEEDNDGKHNCKGFVVGVAHCCAENLIRGSPMDFMDWTVNVVEGTGAEFGIGDP